MVISNFNQKNQEYKLPIFQNLLSIFQHFGQNEKNQMMLFICADRCLQENNDLLLYYTIKFFTELVHNRLITKDQELNYLKKIVPFTIFPSLWIRQQSYAYISALIAKYSPLEFYLHFQPTVKRYLKEDAAFINQEILLTLVPDPIKRTDIDFANKKVTLTNSLSDRQRLIINYFITDYLSKTSPSYTDKDEKDDR